MSTPNFFQFTHKSTTISWYPEGKGGPPRADLPPPGAPVLVYSDGNTTVMAWGPNLTISDTGAGSFVVGVVQHPVLPGATVSLGILVPEAIVDAAPVAIETSAVLSTRREVNNIGPGQLEAYKWMHVNGTAQAIKIPL